MTAPFDPPVRLRDEYRSWRWTLASCWPEQATWRLDHSDDASRYVKVYRAGRYPSLLDEAQRTKWARTWLPVPEVLDVGTDEQFEWLITRGLPGRPAIELQSADPRPVVIALAEGLRRFHEHAPAEDCPFDFSLSVALPHVARRVEQGRVDPAEDFNDDHHDLDLPSALAALDTLRPSSEDLVVCHGDYCPPNILIADGRAAGFVDLGELGVADRWWDLAVATWATTWNYGPGLEPLFLAAYGADVDDDRHSFYRLLYDLAS